MALIITNGNINGSRSSQYATKIRERKKDATPEDFDLIGTEYHRWVRNHEELLDLSNSATCYQWVRRDLDFYARVYLKLLKASHSNVSGLESVRYNADHGFTQQYQLLLAPLQPGDDKATIQAKLKLVADYIDCWLNLRLWNFKSVTYSTVQYAVFQLTKELRGLSVEDLRTSLVTRLQWESVDLTFNNQPYLNNWNAKSLHRQLARMIDWVETQSGEPGQYSKYVVRSGQYAYEIEHIWANRYERHTDEFDSSAGFSEYRNRIGGLLLLPKKVNASLGDKDYDYKVEQYLKENLLAKSLHPTCYQNNPGFKQMIQRMGIEFQPHATFKKADLEQRFRLYQSIADRLWSVERLQGED